MERPIQLRRPRLDQGQGDPWGLRDARTWSPASPTRKKAGSSSAPQAARAALDSL